MTLLNWYKLAQSKSKSLAEMLQSLQDDSDVDPNTLDWVRSLPDREASVVIRNLLSNPSIPLDRLKGFVSRSQRDRAKYQESFNPLTPDMETYARNQGELADWLKYNLLSRKGEAREKLFQHIEENVDFVRDWYNMGFRDDPESRPKLDGNLTFERAVLLSERWHDRQVRSGSTEYEPTDPRNIIKKYPNGWTWQKITSENDAIAEGNIMDHCIGMETHCDAIRIGQEIPYSLRDENNKPKVTTTFKYQHALLDEAKGFHNADPAPHMDYLKDLFAIFKPRYSKEKYLSGKLDELGMKDWTRLKEEDVETDTFLQKVVNNAIIRGDEIFRAAYAWAKNKLKSGQAPEEWIKGISKYIQSNGHAPIFAEEWAKKKLDSGQAPQEWIESISKYIQKYGDAPDFAEEWVKVKLDSGQAPQEWIEGISKHIQEHGDAPYFAYDWAENMLKSGKAPDVFINNVLFKIYNNGETPNFAKNWVNDQINYWLLNSNSELESAFRISDKIVDSVFGNFFDIVHGKVDGEDFVGSLVKHVIKSNKIPAYWEDMIVERVTNDVMLPDLIYDLAQEQLDSGKAPQWLIDAVSAAIQKNGRAPHFARDWAKNKLESGQAPQELIDAVNEFIKMKWYTPDFAEDWAKNKLDSEQAPQWLIESVSKHIQEYGVPPRFADDWAKKKLDSGQAPQEWVESISKYIQKYGDAPDFAEEWVKVKLDSGQAPQEWIESVYKSTHNRGYAPVFANDWVKKTLDSGQAPQEWIEGISKYIQKNGKSPGFAKNWAKEKLDSGQAPQEWIDAVNKHIQKYGRAPDFAYDWAKKTLDSGQAPEEWIERINKYIQKNEKAPFFAEDWYRRKLDR